MTETAIHTLLFFGGWFLASAILTAVYVGAVLWRKRERRYQSGRRYWMAAPERRR